VNSKRASEDDIRNDTLMIDKTEALVLRVHSFSETSHIVVWLTPEHGKVVTVIKGACRPKSPFLGQYDLFYTCELLFYRRERDGVHIARECAPLETRPRLRTDWRAAACASYLSSLVSGISFAGGHQPEVYRHTVTALDFLNASGAGLPFLFWFELRLAGILGFAPQLRQCSICNARLPNPRPAFFLWERGGLLCPACVKRPGHRAVESTPDILALLRRWQEAESPLIARNTRCTGNQLFALRENVGTFLQFHLDLPPAARRIALELMSTVKLP
jgi:DNA repair protein RecO (recombination protein O)